MSTGEMSAADIVSAQATLEALADDPSDWATFAVRGVAENGARAITALTAEVERLKNAHTSSELMCMQREREILDVAVERERTNSANNTLRAENERLKGERDEARHDRDEACSEQLHALADARQLRAQLERLRAAVEPFAKAALAYPDLSGNVKVIAETRSKEYPNFYLTSRDLWAAYDALASLTQQDAKDGE